MNIQMRVNMMGLAYLSMFIGGTAGAVIMHVPTIITISSQISMVVMILAHSMIDISAISKIVGSYLTRVIAANNAALTDLSAAVEEMKKETDRTKAEIGQEDLHYIKSAARAYNAGKVANRQN